MALLGLPPDDLRRFPRRTHRGDVDLYRIHPSGLGPWWFSSDTHGRFDLAPPSGTCYLAASPSGAFVETFRDFTFVNADDVAARSLSRLRLRRDCVLADCTSPRALSFRLTAAVHTTADYATTQAWAAAFAEAGFDGIRYFCGHDPSQQEIALAIFGDAGEVGWAIKDSGPIPHDAVEAVERRFGIHVLPPVL